MEEWRDIEGFEGKYQVSNMGRVKSLNYNHTGKERILKAGKSNIGYLQVDLCKDGKGKSYKIHRLVAQAFIPNPENYNEINHVDENKENNRVENLEWCDRSYNCNYGTRNKKSAEKRRNDLKMSKPVVGINKVSGLILEFPSAKEASRVTGVNQSSISACCKGKRYKSAGGYFWQYIE